MNHMQRPRLRKALLVPVLLSISLTCLYATQVTASLSQSASLPPPALFQSRQSNEAKGAEFLQHVLTNPSVVQSNSNRDSESDYICKPTGQIEDASCDYETVETINSQFFQRLDQLRKTDFFKFYRANLFKECPFWRENGLCMNRACSVETEDESDIPKQFRVNSLSSVTTAHSAEVSPSISDSSCSCSSTEFCHLEDVDSSDAVYVDLLKNPERFTGYAGPSANRVWKSIYEENCFGGAKFIEPARPVSSGGSGFINKAALLGNTPAGHGLSSLMASLQAPVDSGDTEQCLEKRVFYRIISGLHASISIHICHDFLDQKTGEWAPNLECFITRIAEHPERLQNVYFDYVLLLRALSQLGDSTENFSLHEGDSITDPVAAAQLDQLIQDARDCPATFDEARMFSGQSKESIELKQEFRQHFRNISAIMDCVGCDKCRLWGKLQVNGIGTALKLLFNGNEAGEKKPVRLQRSELVALVNAAHRIAESLRAVETFREMYQAQPNVANRVAKKNTLKEEERRQRAEKDKQEQERNESQNKLSESKLSLGEQQRHQTPSQQQRDEKGSSISSPVSSSLSPTMSPAPLNKSGNSSSSPPAASCSTPLLESLRSVLRWTVSRLEMSLESCRRSIEQCLDGLGLRSSLLVKPSRFPTALPASSPDLGIQIDFQKQKQKQQQQRQDL